MNLNKNRRALRGAAPAVVGLALASLLPVIGASAQKPTATPKRQAKAVHAASSVVTTAPVSACVILKLKGLDCPVCARQVQRSLMSVAGVQSADVSVPKQTAVVRLAGKNPPKNDALTAAVKKAGFSVTAVQKGKSKE